LESNKIAIFFFTYQNFSYFIVESSSLETKRERRREQGRVRGSEGERKVLKYWIIE
jgi:hypothetical protein